MSTVTNPLGDVLAGMVQAHGIAHQIKQQAMQEEAHQRMMADSDRESQMKDIQARMMLDQNARPVTAGTISDSMANPSPVPGLPNENVNIARPVDKSRKVTYKGRDGQSQDYELLTPDEQMQRQTQRTAQSQSMLEDAKTSADLERSKKMRNATLTMQGGGVPATGLSTLGIPDGTPLTREEFAGAVQHVATIRKEGMFTLKPGEKLTDVSGVQSGGAPQTVATGGEPLPTDDFGKYFLPAYAAKTLNKPLAEVTPEDIKSLKPEQMQDAFTQFGTSKETPDTKAMRQMAMETQQLHHSMLQMQIGQMPTPDDAKVAAQMVANHQMSPSQMTATFGGFGAQGQAFKRMVVKELTKIDPNFNFEEAESTYGLVKSPAFQNTVRYMDSVQESIPLVIDRANKLANGNIRGINALVNAGKNQFNGVDLKKFQTDRTLVADEIAKILQGGGTGSGTSDAKLKQASEILGSTDSPRAIAAAMGEVQSLIGYRRKAMTRGTYMEGTQAKGAEPAAAASYAQTATGPDGHKIGTNDGGKTWMDVATGQAVK